MSIIRTDYMTPMSNIGAGANQFMQTAASTVGRIPEDRERMAALKEQKEIAQLNKEKLLSDKKYFVEQVNSLYNDIVTSPVGDVPFENIGETKKLANRIEWLRDNPSEKAIDELATIAKNYSVVSSTRKQFGDENIFKGPYLTFKDATNPKYADEYLVVAKTAKENYVNQKGISAASQLIKENSDPKTGNPPDTEVLVGKLVTMMSDPNSGFPSGSETKALGWIKEASLGQKERLTAEAAGINAAARRTQAATSALKTKEEVSAKPTKNSKTYSEIEERARKDSANYKKEILSKEAFDLNQKKYDDQRIVLQEADALDIDLESLATVDKLLNDIKSGKLDTNLKRKVAERLELSGSDVSRTPPIGGISQPQADPMGILN